MKMARLILMAGVLLVYFGLTVTGKKFVAVYCSLLNRIFLNIAH